MFKKNKYTIKTVINTNNTFKNLLSNKIEENENYNKNGLYEIKHGCNTIHIGQMELKTRFREHIRCYKYEKKDLNFALQAFIRRRTQLKRNEIITLL